MEDDHLVPGRECGTCTACCVVFAINDGPVNKPAGVACPHSAGGGCAIYGSRPQTCRDFFCEWRRFGRLDDAWRPDRCGVMLFTTQIDGAPTGTGLVFAVFGDHAVIFSQPFVELVTFCIARGVEAVLCLANGAGDQSRYLTLSPFVQPAVASGDAAGVDAGLRAAYADALTIPI